MRFYRHEAAAGRMGGKTMRPETTPAEARAYIAVFRKHTLSGTEYVDTQHRRIQLNDMTDDDALFVASEFKRMEIAAAAIGDKDGKANPRAN
jgi:hypothetical protein